MAMPGEEEGGVPWVPPYVGHRGAVRALVVNTRKDGEGEIRQCKESDGNGDNDCHRLVNREKEYNEAGEKQEHRDVKECRDCLDRKTRSVDPGTEEQKRANSRAVLPVRVARDSEHLGISACPLLEQRGKQGRCDAKY